MVSCSPATTCAAVTIRFRPATQPVPSMPTPQAVPRTLTTRVVAARIDGSRSTPLLGGSVGALGPMTDGIGSMRASRFSSVRGGRAESSCLTIAERSTSWRNPVSPGESSATEAATQTTPTPIAMPRRRPPAESISRSGVNRIPPRMNEATASAPYCRSTAPSTAPTRPATGVHVEFEPPCSRCGARREPMYAPTASPTSEKALRTRPRLNPPTAAMSTIAIAIQSAASSPTAPE